MEEGLHEELREAQRAFFEALARVEDAKARRRAAFEKAHHAGWSLREIGHAVALSRSRVHQVIRKED